MSLYNRLINSTSNYRRRLRFIFLVNKYRSSRLTEFRPIFPDCKSFCMRTYIFVFSSYCQVRFTRGFAANSTRLFVLLQFYLRGYFSRSLFFIINLTPLSPSFFFLILYYFNIFFINIWYIRRE